VQLKPGTRLGPYEVLGPLGEGGMSLVYRARDTRLGREVAVKMVAESLATDAGSLARFEQEARLAGALNHPNIIVVFDVGVLDGTPYLVTELLEGETLRSRLRRSPVPFETALDWAAQMASGLAAAHAKGIIHRDLKPDNVFVTRSAHIKLLDFGLAKLTEAVPTQASHPLMEDTVTPSLATRSGAVLGTPGYMSPEQVRGEPVDARTDYFSFGAVFYELLSGRRAFPGGSVVDSGYAILHTQPEPLPEGVAPAVAQVVRHCLEKDPEDRFQSARDLAFSVEALGTPSSLARGGKPARAGGWLRRRWSALALVAFALAVGFLVGVRVARSTLPQLQFPTVRQLTFRQGAILSARFAPDARTVLFTASWGGEPARIYSTTIDSPEYHPVGLEDAFLQAVSSLGELAVILHPETSLGHISGTLARLPGVGGAPREIVDNVWSANWAPDGTQLVVVRQLAGKWRLEFPVGHVLVESVSQLSLPCISPDAQRVAFVEHGVSFDTAGTVVVMERSGQRRVMAEKWDSVTGLAFGPNGAELWLSGAKSLENESLWAVAADTRPRLLYRGTGRLTLDDVAVDGRALVHESETWEEIAVVKADGKGTQEHLGWFDWPLLGGLSPDGSTVLFTEAGWAVPPPYSVYLRKTDGSAPVHLGEGLALALSPDGKWAMATRDDQPSRLWLYPTGAGVSRSLELTGLSYIRSGFFFPDMKRAAFLARDASAIRAYVLDLDSGKAHPVTPPLECCALAVSPEGQFFAAMPAEGVLTAYPVEEGPPKPFPQLGRSYYPVHWGTSGLLVRQGHESPVQVFRVDPRTGGRQALFTLNPPATNGPTRIWNILATPDEKTVAYDYSHSSGRLFVLKLR
jgi:hypothetical protein